MNIDGNEEIGLTSQQILAAPERAVYVVVNPQHLIYVRSLAAHLGRQDLQIVVPGWLRLGRAPDHVVVDHAVHIGLIPSSQRLEWRRAIDALRERQRLVTLADLRRQLSPSE